VGLPNQCAPAPILPKLGEYQPNRPQTRLGRRSKGSAVRDSWGSSPKMMSILRYLLMALTFSALAAIGYGIYDNGLSSGGRSSSDIFLVVAFVGGVIAALILNATYLVLTRPVPLMPTGAVMVFYSAGQGKRGMAVMKVPVLASIAIACCVARAALADPAGGLLSNVSEFAGFRRRHDNPKVLDFLQPREPARAHAHGAPSCSATGRCRVRGSGSSPRAATS